MGIILICMLSLFKGTAQVIPAERLVDWSLAGYPAPIPDPQLVIDAVDFGAVGDSLSDNSQALASAIDYLDGKRGVILFPPGKYIFYSSIDLTDSIIIRGASSDQTHFIFDLGGAAENCINISRSQTEAFVEVSGGYEKGSRKLIVEDPGSFEANTFAELRQENGNWDTEPISWAEYSVGQILFIENIVADTLLLKNALRIDYDDELDPEIRPLNIITETGMECFKITRADNTLQGVGSNFYLAFAANCWIRGVESHFSVGSHIYLTQSSRIEISGCYVHEAYAYDGSGTRGYGITLNMHSGECLIENNILKQLRHAMMVKTGANGNVFAYNYSTEPYRSEPIHDLSGDNSLHGHYAFANLFEGNIVQNIIIDHYWGPSGPWNTFFRNRAELYGIIMTSSDTTETDSQNFAGNEVVNTNILYGNYILTGEDQFEYGNNVKGSIVPPGTSDLPDSSYYRENVPPYWDIIDPWPPIGVPHDTNEYSIPAKERYLHGWTRTVCSDSLYTGSNVFKTKHRLRIYPNPGNGTVFIHSDAPVMEVCLINLQGRVLYTEQEPGNKIQLDPELSPGIYILQLKTARAKRNIKLILEK